MGQSVTRVLSAIGPYPSTKLRQTWSLQLFDRDQVHESSDLRRIETEIYTDNLGHWKWGGLMATKAGLIAVVAVLLGALCDGSLSVESAHTEESCLATPSAPPPQGSHWYYHLDRIKHIKCWYLRAEGQAIQKPALQENSEGGFVVANSPTTEAPKTARGTGPEPQELRPVQAAPTALAGRLTQGNIQDAGQAGRQAGTGAVPWPGSMAWPDPLPVAGGISAQSTTEEKAPIPVANSGKDTRIDAGLDRWVATTIEIPGSRSEIPVTMLLTFAVGLTISGVLVGRIARVGSPPPNQRG